MARNEAAMNLSRSPQGTVDPAGGGNGYAGAVSGFNSNKLDMSDVDVSHCNGDIQCMRETFGKHYDDTYLGTSYNQNNREGAEFDCSSYARRREASIQAAINNATGQEIYDTRFQDASFFGGNTAAMAANTNFGDAKTTGLKGTDIRAYLESAPAGDYIVMFERDGQSNHTVTFSKKADGTLTFVESGNIGFGTSATHTADGEVALSKLEKNYSGANVRYSIINTGALARNKIAAAA
jgi:hypothetical protein